MVDYYITFLKIKFKALYDGIFTCDKKKIYLGPWGVDALSRLKWRKERRNSKKSVWKYIWD